MALKASKRKGAKTQKPINSGFLMIHSTLRDQDMSFWGQVCRKHKTLYFLWNEAEDFIEVTEAFEVREAAEILRPGKLLLRTPDSSRF